MSAVLNRISTFPEVAAVTSPYGPRGAGQISHDGRIAYATVGFTRQAGNLATADVTRVIDAVDAARDPRLDVQLGGQAIGHTEQPPLSVGSAVGVLAAAVVLFIAFGSLLAMLLPLITAIAGVVSGLMRIALLTHGMSVVDLAPKLGALIGLGVGIDYALFIVTRHRRGLEAGLSPQDAAVTAIDTSGRAVLFAGGTVCVALLGILVLGGCRVWRRPCGRGRTGCVHTSNGPGAGRHARVRQRQLVTAWMARPPAPSPGHRAPGGEAGHPSSRDRQPGPDGTDGPLTTSASGPGPT
jgi:RND superfamily putative drug exporter